MRSGGKCVSISVVAVWTIFFLEEVLKKSICSDVATRELAQLSS